jgi:putative inorganic carbon (hco3(-)) transporter
MSQAVVKRPGKGMMILMGIAAFALTYIITKDVRIPTPFIIIGALLGSIALLTYGFAHPEVVTYALVAYLPFSKELAGDFSGAATALNFTNLLMGYLVLVWMSGRFSVDEPPWLKTPLNLPIYLFMIVGFISICRGTYYGTGYFHQAFTEYKRWMTPIFLFFLVLNTMKDRDTIKNVVMIMIMVTTLVGLMAIYDYIELGSVSSLEKSRIGGICDQPNMLAAFFNYYMFLPFGFFITQANRAKSWLYLIPFAICFRGVMVTFSRGGYLAFALGLYAVAFFRSKMLFIVMLFSIGLLIIFPQALPPGIRYRMAQTFEKQVSYSQTAEQMEASLESSAGTRIAVWRGALKMIGDNPIFGVGYGLFEYKIPYYWEQHKRIDAHNTYLIIAAEMGIPELLIFLWIIGAVFFQTRALYYATSDPFTKSLCLGFIGGIFGLLMSNMFGSRLDSQEVSSYFWILAALVMRLAILEGKQDVIFKMNSKRKLDGSLAAIGIDPHRAAKTIVVPTKRKLDHWVEYDQKANQDFVPH